MGAILFAWVLKDYLEWIVSEEGQEIIVELGFVPLRQE